MLDLIKHFIHAVISFQNNTPALVTTVALGAMGVSAFALYVVLTIVGR